MALRPRLNLESTLYQESYDCETEGLIQKRDFLQEFIELQRDIEHDANDQIKAFQELKKRRVNEIIAGEFKFSDNKVMVNRPGSDEYSNQAGETLEF